MPPEYNTQGGDPNFASINFTESPHVQREVPPLVQMDSHGNYVQVRPASGGHPPQTPGQNPLQPYGQFPPQTPVQNPIQPPGQFPPQTPVQNPPQTPGQFPPQTPGQNPLQPPGQFPPQTPVQNPLQTPGQFPPQTPGQDTSIFNQIKTVEGQPASQNPFNQLKEQQVSHPTLQPPKNPPPLSLEEYSKNFKNINTQFIQKSYEQGLTPAQTQNMYSSYQDVEKNFQKNEVEKFHSKVDKTEAILRGIWGDKFDKNISLISNHIKTQTVHPGEEGKFQEAQIENLKPFLSNHILAQNLVQMLSGSESDPVLQQGRPNQNTAFSKEKEYITSKKEYGDLLQFPERGIGHNDPNIRSQAYKRLEQLKGYLYTVESQNPISYQETPKDTSQEGGFFGGLQRILGRK